MIDMRHLRTSIAVVPLPSMTEAFHEAAKAILISEKFKEIHYKNPETNQDEIVWKRGDGYIMLGQYIKLDYQPTQLVISGWTRAGKILFSNPENDLDGLYGFAAKDAIRKVMYKIAALAQQGPQVPQGQ